MASPVYPLTFEPALQHYVWGGRNLETFYGRKLPPGKTAESWEVSAHPNGLSVVDSGPLEGETIPELMESMGEALLGRNCADALRRRRFPILIKLLDAQRDLSVQVHPGDAYAFANENGENGKAEMWRVLHAEPEARLIVGLKRGTTPGIFLSALKEGELGRWLHYVKVEEGDVIFIAPGSLHALLAGSVVVEIQQSSDVTYRVYDWNRLGDDGKPRPLHIEKAMDVIDFLQIEPPLTARRLVERGAVFRHDELAGCRHFVVEELHFYEDGVYGGNCDGSTFEVWGCIGGSARVEWKGMPVELPAIRFSLLPAWLGKFSIRASAGSTLMRVRVPPPAC